MTSYCIGSYQILTVCVCPYLSFSKLDLRARRTVIAERVGCILENAPQEDVRNVTGLLAWSFVHVLRACMYVHVCLCVHACVFCAVFDVHTVM